MAKKGPLISILFLSSTIIAGLSLQAKTEIMDYRDWEEGRLRLSQLAESGQLNIIRIGPSSYPGIDQYAVKISKLGTTEDDGQKNAILFECGMHAREWFAAESCYRLIDYLVLNHMISMAVVVHGPDQKLHNLWYQSHLPSKFMTDILVTKSLAGGRAGAQEFCTVVRLRDCFRPVVSRPPAGNPPNVVAAMAHQLQLLDTQRCALCICLPGRRDKRHPPFRL